LVDSDAQIQVIGTRTRLVGKLNRRSIMVDM
jgi:hypothetical protein